MSTIAERIIVIADELCGGNMSELARKIGVTPAYISKLKKDPSAVPSDLVITNICNLYNVNRDWLKNGEGEMFLPLDRDKQIADFMRSLFDDSDDQRTAAIKRGFIAAIAKLGPDDWARLAEIAQDWLAAIDEDEE